MSAREPLYPGRFPLPARADCKKVGPESPVFGKDVESRAVERRQKCQLSPPRGQQVAKTGAQGKKTLVNK